MNFSRVHDWVHAERELFERELFERELFEFTIEGSREREMSKSSRLGFTLNVSYLNVNYSRVHDGGSRWA